MKLLNYISYLTLILAFLAIGIVLYWSVYPYQPLEIKSQPIKIVNKIVKQGGELNYSMSFCKNINIPSELSRSFINEIVYVLPNVATNNPTGCHDLNGQLQVPDELPPDDYFLRLIYSYRVNPIRTVSVTVQTEQFEVVSK